MVKLLVVYCHPVPNSFNAVLRDAVVESAEHAHHEVRVIDLHAEGFDPVMGEQERLHYPVPDVNEVPVKAHLERLRWCTGLIFVYPTWWYGQPAMLKGWIDRVWVPHATFTLPTDRIDWTPHLTNIRLMGVVTTLGSPWWWWTVGMGAPGRKVLLRSLRLCCHPRCRTFWLALHRMDSTTAGQRHAFVEKVRRRMLHL